MYYTRIFSDENGDSHFEMVPIPMTDKGIMGFMSLSYEVKTLIFRENRPDYNWDFHNAPARQFIILLDGEIEITTSLGVIRRFKAGEILLVEDITGVGHRTKNIIKDKRTSIFITL